MIPSKGTLVQNSDKRESEEEEARRDELGDEEEEEDAGMVIDEDEVVAEEVGVEDGEEGVEEEGEEVTGEMVVQGEEGLYQVERILAKRLQAGNVEYLIKWDGKLAVGGLHEKCTFFAAALIKGEFL